MICKPGRKGTYHDQVGYWLWEPATETIIHSLTTRVTDPVAALFEAVIHHAGSTNLGDDATIVLVQWDASGTHSSGVTATRI